MLVSYLTNKKTVLKNYLSMNAVNLSMVHYLFSQKCTVSVGGPYRLPVVHEM